MFNVFFLNYVFHIKQQLKKTIHNLEITTYERKKKLRNLLKQRMKSKERELFYVF